MTNVIVVVDPDYGNRIEAASQIAPIWAVASFVNKAACERTWAANGIIDHRERGAVTCYDVTDHDDRLGNLLTILPTLEEHHGEIRDNAFSFPNGFVLGVLGLTATETVTSALKEFGFSAFVGLAEGFQACK